MTSAPKFPHIGHFPVERDLALIFSDFSLLPPVAGDLRAGNAAYPAYEVRFLLSASMMYKALDLIDPFQLGYARYPLAAPVQPEESEILIRGAHKTHYLSLAHLDNFAQVIKLGFPLQSFPLKYFGNS